MSAAVFRDDIEGLRAVAVVLVVVFHASPALLTGGYVGVDVFFVISGFLITQLLVRELLSTGTISLRRFFARRARRLLPLSCLVLLATTVAAIVALPPLNRADVGAEIRAAALFWGNWHFASSSTQYMGDVQTSPVLHFWSLGVEEQFYVAWPLLLLVGAGTAAAARDKRMLVSRRLRFVLASVGMGSLALSAFTTATSGAYAFYGLHTRAWELALGACIALTDTTWISGRTASALGAVGLALIAGSALAFGETTTFPGIAALVPCLGAACMLGSGGRGIVRFLGHKVPRYIGRLSYAWYLWHWPCFVFARGELPATAALIGSLVLAVVTHHMVEQPLRRSAWLAAVPGRSIALGAMLTFISVLAATSLPLLTDLSGASERTPAYFARIDQVRGVDPCYATFEGVDAAPECHFGDVRARATVALVGDSHAHAWFPAIDRWAKARGYRVYFWAKRGCPITDVSLWQREMKRAYSECVSWRASVFARLREIGPVDAVIVGRSHWYSSLLMHDDERLPVDASESMWRAGMQRTMDELRTIARRIVLLRAVPRPPYDVPACISKRSEERHLCDFRFDVTTWNDRRIEEAERAISAAHPEVVRVDMTNAVCPANPCSVYSLDGTIKFRDHHHLTATFSASLWEEIGARLDAALR